MNRYFLWILHFCFEAYLEEGDTPETFGFRQSTILEAWFQLAEAVSQGVHVCETTTIGSEVLKLFIISFLNKIFCN